MKKVYTQGEIIRFIRIFLGYDERKMSSLLGMTQPNYSYLERHRKTFPQDLLDNIASIFNISRATLENFELDRVLKADTLLKEKNARIKQLERKIEDLSSQLEERDKTIEFFNNRLSDQEETIKEQLKLVNHFLAKT